MKVAIIGGNRWLATGYQLLQRFPGTELLVLEKEAALDVTKPETNSGVLHCGLYYKPGSTKARLAVQGVRRWSNFVSSIALLMNYAGRSLSQQSKMRFHASTHFLNGKGQWLRMPPASRTGTNSRIRAARRRSRGIRVPQEACRLQGCRWAMADEISARGGDIRFHASHSTPRVQDLANRNDLGRVRSGFSDQLRRASLRSIEQVGRSSRCDEDRAFEASTTSCGTSDNIWCGI